MGERRHLLWITLDRLETELNFYLPKESCKGTQTYAKNVGKKCQWQVHSWSQPSLPSPWAPLWIRWAVLAAWKTRLQIHLYYSGGMRTWAQGQGPWDLRGVEGQCNNRGSLESHQLCHQSPCQEFGHPCLFWKRATSQNFPFPIQVEVCVQNRTTWLESKKIIFSSLLYSAIKDNTTQSTKLWDLTQVMISCTVPLLCPLCSSYVHFSSKDGFF